MPEERLVLPIEPYHTLIYGESGTGKTSFASTGRKPQLVFLFDPLGKDGPYRRLGKMVNRKLDEFGALDSYEIVSNKTGNLLTRVECYHEDEPTRPNAYMRFTRRMTAFQQEYGMWGSVAFDSLTFALLAFRKYQQYVLNPSSKNPMQWYAGTTDAMEEFLMLRVSRWPMDVYVIAHTSKDSDVNEGGVLQYKVNAPGRLADTLAAAFPEFYHSFVAYDGKERRYLLQTTPSGKFYAASQLGLPDPCVPNFREILRISGTVAGDEAPVEAASGGDGQ